MDITTRNASLADLAKMLKDQHARKVDVVAPARSIHSEGGVLVVEGADAEITEDGVTTTDGRYVPTTVASRRSGTCAPSRSTRSTQPWPGRRRSGRGRR